MTHGLIQFGRFQRGNSVSLVRLQLDFAASYPELLKELADEALSLLRTKRIDRLLSTIDAVPLASLLSLNTGVPLVYSRGLGNFTSADLIGAYYVGHPVCLVLLDGEAAQPHITLWFNNALAAGLEIECVVGIVGQPEKSAIAAEYLFTPHELVQALLEQRLVPRHIAQPVLSQLAD